MYNIIVKQLCLCLIWFTCSHYSLEVHPINDSFGAEIIGLSLETLTDAQFDIVHDTLLRYKVVVVRNQQDLSVEGQRLFSKRLGRLHEHLESSSHLPGYRDVNVVSNIKNSNGSYIGLFGKHVENFHSDLSWCELPTKVTILKSVIRPEECGDTEFLDSNAAYDALSSEDKTRLHGLTARYSYLKLREVNENGVAQNLDLNEVQAAAKSAVHPIVTMHPITGRLNLYSNPSHTVAVNGMTAEDSETLLQKLFLHSASPEFIYRHKYEDNDVIMWDNRAVHHRATGCSDEYPRKLIRTTVSNDAAPEAFVAGIDPSKPFDLEKDRINAEYRGIKHARSAVSHTVVQSEL